MNLLGLAVWYRYETEMIIRMITSEFRHNIHLWVFLELTMYKLGHDI